MPGPVSDSHDPEFGTGANAHDVAEAVRSIRDRVTVIIGNDELKNIVDLTHAEDDPETRDSLWMCEREWRILRFALNRALEGCDGNARRSAPMSDEELQIARSEEDYDQYDDEELAAGRMSSCDCPYCHCFTQTECGARCGDCRSGAHQG